jgi:type IV pilus assembly protein PilC
MSMPTYQYEAMHATGQRATGVVEAVSQAAAVAQIRQTYEIVLDLHQVKGKKASRAQMLRKIDLKALAMVCKQFSIILKSGLPLVQAVDLVAGQTSDKHLRVLLKQVSEDVSNGWSLSQSLAERGSRVLPVTFIETVRAGEESGDLVRSFQRLSGYYERAQRTKAKATSAMIYPACVIVVAVIVVAIIMIYAMPTFSATFESMDIELPGVTRFLIGLSDFLTHYILLIVAVIAGLLLLLRMYQRTEKGGMKLARLALRLPLLGKINAMAGASQFAHTMSTMLAAGMPILQALEVSARSMSNLCLSQEIMDTVPGVEAGHSLGACMNQAKELPEMLVEMTAVGETTGSLESTLDVLAEYYDNEVEVHTARALSLLEPLIICFLAVIVVTILLSVYLPLFAMESGI